MQKNKNGEHQRYSWERRRRRMVNPRDIAGEGRRRIRMVNPRDIAGNAEEEEGEPQRYSWERRRRRR